jgi:hypothetical protein
MTCRRNPAGRLSVGGGGVAGEQAGRVADRFGSQREGRAHRSGGFHDGANRAAGSNCGGAEEHLRAPAQRSWSGGVFGRRSWW